MLIGPGGVALAQNLSKSLKKEDVKIILIERRRFYFHAIGALRAMVDVKFIPQILIPFDNVFESKSYFFWKSASPTTNVEIIFASVENVDYESRTVTYSPEIDSTSTVQYDYLILATGSTYPSPIKPTSDVISREEIIEQLTSFAQRIKDSKSILVIGGGPVGIEMVGELKTYYPNKRVMLIHNGDELLNNQNVEKLRDPVKNALQDIGVELFLKDSLKEKISGHQFGQKNLVTESGLEIESDAQIVCIGMRPNTTLMADPICIDEKNYIKVKETLEVDSSLEQYKNVFVIGDASNHATPKLAYWASQQGIHLANSITKNILKDEPFLPFKGPNTEILILPIGANGGRSQLPFGKGYIVGDFLTRMFKSKDLFTGMQWKALNATMPAATKE